MARFLDLVDGHQELIRQGMDLISRGELSATHLFSGPSGVQKKEVALGFAQALLCEQGRQGCGICGSCLRIARGSSESVRVIEPEKNSIRVEVAREVRQWVGLQKWGQARIFIFEDAHRLNVQAANLLLKTLEEPPADTYFFLLAPSPRHVLPTLASRSRVWRFGRVDFSQVAKWKSSPTWALNASLGRKDLLLRLLHNKENEARQKAWQTLRILLAKSSILDLGENFAEKSELPDILFWMQSFLRDLMVLRAGSSQVWNTDFDFQEILHENRTSEELWRTSQALRELEAQLNHRDVTLALEHLWVSQHGI